MPPVRPFNALAISIVRQSVATICAVLAVVLIALPYGNGWSQARFRPLVGRWYYLTGSKDGRLQLVLLHELLSPVAGPVVPIGASVAYATFVNRFPRRLFWEKGDFGVESGWEISVGNGNPRRQVFAEGIRYWVMVPGWAVAMAAGGLAGVLWLTPPIRAAVGTRKRLRALAADGAVCAVCGYDLRATPDCCPECGAIPPKVGGNSS